MISYYNNIIAEIPYFYIDIDTKKYSLIADKSFLY